MSEEIEVLAAQFHRIYQEEAKRQGDVRHKDSYDDLPENIKDFDRVLARHVLAHFRPLPKEGGMNSQEKAERKLIALAGSHLQDALDVFEGVDFKMRGTLFLRNFIETANDFAVELMGELGTPKEEEG